MVKPEVVLAHGLSVQAGDEQVASGGLQRWQPLPGQQLQGTVQAQEDGIIGVHVMHGLPQGALGRQGWQGVGNAGLAGHSQREIPACVPRVLPGHGQISLIRLVGHAGVAEVDPDKMVPPGQFLFLGGSGTGHQFEAALAGMGHEGVKGRGQPFLILQLPVVAPHSRGVTCRGEPINQPGDAGGAAAVGVDPVAGRLQAGEEAGQGRQRGRHRCARPVQESALAAEGFEERKAGISPGFAAHAITADRGESHHHQGGPG